MMNEANRHNRPSVAEFETIQFLLQAKSEKGVARAIALLELRRDGRGQ